MRYFVAVAEELSFRKAAERLNVSRPALSKQVKDLEDEMAVKLLERDTVSVALTKAGEVFLEDARKLLAGTQQAMIRASEAQSGQRGRLRIGSVGVLANDFLPGTLKRFNLLYPEIEVEFVEMLPAEQIEALASGRIDVGFAYGDQANNVDYLDRLLVIRSTYGVAVSTQHPIAQGLSVRLSDLKSETIFSLGAPGRFSHREAICKIFRDEGMKPSKGRQIEGFDSLVTLISADQGLSLLPEVLDLTKMNVAILPIDGTHSALDFHMWAVWNRRLPTDHLRQFIELLEERLLVAEEA